MNSQPNPKIVGAFLVGFAMVAGAYTLSNFGKTHIAITPAASPIAVTQQAAPVRAAIEVTDEDGNGIEDWRDEFITTEPIILSENTSEEYAPPDSLTGQMGINFVQDLVRARGYGQFGRSDDEVIADTINNLTTETSHPIYDTPDIIINTAWNESDIKNYGNAVAQIIIEEGENDLDHELLILRDIMNRSDTSRIKELATLAEVYRLIRDRVIAVPVPQVFVKEHLDLINTFHALHNDLLGMTLSFDDPAYALLRLKRYEDDVLGLSIALGNTYLALEPYATLFTASDPALFFVEFSPVNNVRI